MTQEAAAVPTAGPPRATVVSKRRIEAADVVVGGSVGLVVLIVGIFVALCFQGYGTTISTSKAHAQLAANIVAEETRWVIASSLGLLDSLAASVTTDPTKLDPQAVAAFKAGAAQLPDGPKLNIFDSTGALVPALSSADGPATIADRDYSRGLRAARTGR